MKHPQTLAIVAASGLAAAANAQALDTNLVANPGFETVDVGIVSFFNSVFISSDWLDVDGDDDDLFAYAYAQNYTSANVPPSSGSYFFTGGDGSIQGVEDIFQAIDVSGGDAATLIATGNAYYDLRAWFSTYYAQEDGSFVRALFLNSGGTEIGSVQIGGADFVAAIPRDGGGACDWSEGRAGGSIPIGTASVLIAAVSDITVDGDYNDGYIDNVDFQVTATLPPVPPSLFSITAPGSGGYVEGVTFDVEWGSSTGADSYTVEVDNDADFSSPEYVATGIVGQLHSIPTNSPIGTGVWNVRASATNTFGTTQSANTSTLAVINPCMADLNGDSFLDNGDITVFISLFLAGCP